MWPFRTKQKPEPIVEERKPDPLFQVGDKVPDSSNGLRPIFIIQNREQSFNFALVESGEVIWSGSMFQVCEIVRAEVNRSTHT